MPAGSNTSSAFVLLLPCQLSPNLISQFSVDHARLFTFVSSAVPSATVRSPQKNTICLGCYFYSVIYFFGLSSNLAQNTMSPLQTPIT